MVQRHKSRAQRQGVKVAKAQRVTMQNAKDIKGTKGREQKVQKENEDMA